MFNNERFVRFLHSLEGEPYSPGAGHKKRLPETVTFFINRQWEKDKRLMNEAVIFSIPHPNPTLVGWGWGGVLSNVLRLYRIAFLGSAFISILNSCGGSAPNKFLTK